MAGRLGMFDEDGARQIRDAVRRVQRQPRNNVRPMRPQRMTPRATGADDEWYLVVVLLEDLNFNGHAMAQVVEDGDPSSGTSGSSGSQGLCDRDPKQVRVWYRWGCALAGEEIGVLLNKRRWDAIEAACGCYEGALQSCEDCDTSSSSSSASSAADCSSSACGWVWTGPYTIAATDTPTDNWRSVEPCPTGCTCRYPTIGPGTGGDIPEGYELFPGYTPVPIPCVGPTVGILPGLGGSPPIDTTGGPADFDYSGSDLTTFAIVTIEGLNPANFQLSSDGGSTWHSSLSFTPTAGSVSGTAKVRHTGTMPVSSHDATLKINSGIAAPASVAVTYSAIP